MVTTRKEQRNISDCKVADMLADMTVSEFRTWLNDYAIENIIKGTYDEAITIRAIMTDGRHIIA